jgi:transposase-like protein
VPDPEVPEHPSRRRFTAAYKLRILREAEACTQPGQLGALLRREGLYSSHLATWRKQAEGGALSALSAHARGPKPARPDAVEIENARLRRENEQLLERLTQAEAVIEIQKKLSQLFARPQALQGGGR